MKTTSIPGWISGASLLLAFTATSSYSQDNATETAKKAAESAFKNPALQEMLDKVKKDPDTALKDVSKIAKEQMNKIGGIPAISGAIPATRAEVIEPGLPTVSVPSRPAPVTTAVPTPATNTAPQMQIPEPVARGERPVPVSKTEVREPSLTPVSNPQVAPIGLPVAVPEPRPLTPKYIKETVAPEAPKRAAGADQMDITADASVMDERNSILTFTGNVVVQHPGFNLTGDKLVIFMNDEQGLDGQQSAGSAEEEAPFKKAIATGGMVEIVRKGADGKSQIAKSRKADYNAATGDIILSGGPPTLQNGGVFINPSSPQALIILKGNGQHEVKGEGGRVGFSMPIKGGAGKGTSKGIPGGSLDSITNKRE